MEIRTIGEKWFDDHIDITDPCYNRDVWCRMNDVKIKGGEYVCWVGVLSNIKTNGWGERVGEIGIRFVDAAKDLHYEKIANIGVDAGLAGFFNEKPDYTTEQWDEICGLVLNHEETRAWITDDGFFSSSGYGDGGYNVYAAKTDGEIEALYIQFIPEEDEEE